LGARPLLVIQQHQNLVFEAVVFLPPYHHIRTPTMGSSHEQDRRYMHDADDESNTLFLRSNSSISDCKKPSLPRPQEETMSIPNDAKLKFWLLVLLVVQGSSAILAGRYTRSSVPEDELYEISHLVFIIECVKFFASLVAEYISTNGRLKESLQEHIFHNPFDSCKVLVPAILYVIQNCLVYIALSNLTAPVFVSLQQGKLIATALVSVAMLNRSYSTKQWVCLFVLAMGVSIVALDEQEEQHQQLQFIASQDEAEVVLQEEQAAQEVQQLLLVGVLAVTGACLSSAFAGVYFEKVLAPEKVNIDNASYKKVRNVEAQSTTVTATATITTTTTDKPSQPSLWIRNLQLAFFSIIFVFLQGLCNKKAVFKMSQMNSSGDKSSMELSMGERPYFHGFTKYVWLLVVLQAGGGLLVAAVMKYADNVLKGLAMGIGMVVATMFSTLLFGVHLSSQLILGAGIILVSVYCFSNDIPFLPSKTNTTLQNS